MFKKIAVGVIAYINSFILLDWLRENYKGRPGMALVVVIVATLIILAIFNLENAESSTFPPPEPQMPAETFQRRRYTTTS